MSWHLYVRLGVPEHVGEVSFVPRCCFVARVPGSLAGGFLVAVAGRALFLLFLCSGFKRLLALVLSGCFTFSPAKWGPPQLNEPVQLYIGDVTKTVY